MENSMFSEKVLTITVAVLCSTIVAVLFGMKASRVNSLRALNYAHFLVFSLYMTSWFFASTASLFLAVLGMTPTFTIISDLSSSTVWYTDSQGASQVIQTNDLAGQDESIVLARQEKSLYSTMCHLSILLCVFMYTSAKLMLYLFLAERVHIVRDSRIARKDSFLYRVNMLLLIPYAGITAGMYIQRITRFTPSADQCEIGVELPTLLVLLSYDTAVSIYLTVLFIQPLVRVNYKNQHRFLYVAKRTLIGAVISLTISILNVVVLVIANGVEKGHVCLASCILDVTLNTLSVHWVTSNAIRGRNPSEEDDIDVAGSLKLTTRSYQQSTIVGRGGSGDRLDNEESRTAIDSRIGNGPNSMKRATNNSNGTHVNCDLFDCPGCRRSGSSGRDTLATIVDTDGQRISGNTR